LTGLSEEETINIWEDCNALNEKTKESEDLQELDEMWDKLTTYWDKYKDLCKTKAEDIDLLIQNIKIAEKLNTNIYLVRERFISAKLMKDDVKEADLRTTLEGIADRAEKMKKVID
jgi:hypothetical protein